MDIVAVQRDVQFAKRHFGAFELEDALFQAPRERNAARAQANQDERLNPFVVLDDLVGQSGYGAPNIVGAKQLLLPRFGHHVPSFAVSQGRS
jgi:hypothetical protein